jgi:outer membrane receptor protein involved in Fe transport
VDDSYDSPLYRADVILINTNDSLLELKTFTDIKGRFLFDKVAFGRYRIDVRKTGYKHSFKKEITIDSAGYPVVLDTIRLKNLNYITEEVLVESEKPEFEFGTDKKVFNVNPKLVTKGESAIDLLKKVPMVTVDVNDAISLRGSSNLKILINGKESKLITNLRQLPADMIKKVELITNPSAKYESEGVSGIINIVLKKESYWGINGSLYLGAGSNDIYYGSLNSNLKRGKFAASLNYYYGIYKHKFNSSSLRENYSTGGVSYLEEISSGDGKNNYHYISGGTEYEFNNKHMAGADFYLSLGKYLSGNKTQNKQLDSLENIASFFTRENTYDGKWKSINLSLFYNGKFKKPDQELSADISYSGSDNDNVSNLSKQDFFTAAYPFKQNDYSKYKSFTVNSKADYLHPFTKDTRLETGFKGIYRSNDNDFRSDTLDRNLNQYTTNSSISNHFIYKEQIYALYGLFGSKIKDFSFKIGLRLELTFTKGELVTNGQSFTKNYLSLFPSVNLSQKLGKTQELQLSYSMRISRPNIYRLNPFVNSYDPLNLFVGNPDLNPEFTDSYELSFIKYLNTTTISSSAFFRYSHDVISRYSYLRDSSVTVSTYKNLSNSKSYGLDLICNSQLLNWLGVNGSFGVYKTEFDGGEAESNSEGYSWRASISTYLSLPDIINLQLFYNLQGSRYFAQGSSKPSQSLDAGISKMFFDNRLVINLRVSDVLKTLSYDSEINGVGFKQTYTSNYQSRILFLTVSFRFGKIEESQEKRKKGNDTNMENTSPSEDGLK